MIEYTCTHCGAAMSSPASLAGQMDICPACDKWVDVPGDLRAAGQPAGAPAPVSGLANGVAWPSYRRQADSAPADRAGQPAAAPAGAHVAIPFFSRTVHGRFTVKHLAWAAGLSLLSLVLLGYALKRLFPDRVIRHSFYDGRDVWTHYRGANGPPFWQVELSKPIRSGWGERLRFRSAGPVLPSGEAHGRWSLQEIGANGDAMDGLDCVVWYWCGEEVAGAEFERRARDAARARGR